MKNINIFGIKITIANYETFLNVFFQHEKKTFCCVNQYYLNLAYENENYRNQLKDFDIVHIDGIGAYFAVLFLSNFRISPPRITGSDLYIKILQKMEEKGLSLFLLGDSSQVLDTARIQIQSSFPNLKVIGFQNGYANVDNIGIINNMISLNPDVIFVGLGAKRQEMWINKWKKYFPESRIIAVGGGIRIIAGDRERGSQFIRKIGMEWFVRLVTEPKFVWKRYLIGIPVFLYRIFLLKLKTDFKA